MKKKFLCLLLFFFINYLSYSQVELPVGTPQQAPSMNISGSVGNTNVDMSSGVQGTSFTLASLDGHAIGTSVNLIYTHGQGIRVNEISSIVGLGFDLSVGGTLTRNLRGVPDEFMHDLPDDICHLDTPWEITQEYFDSHPGQLHGLQVGDDIYLDTTFYIDENAQRYLYGWFDRFDFHDQYGFFIRASDLEYKKMAELGDIFYNNTSISQLVGHSSEYNLAKYHYLYTAAGGGFDAEPDIFNFNFDGYSGSFVLQQDGSPLLLYNQDIKIEPAIGPLAGTSWIFTVPNGTKYVFENSDEYRETLVSESETGYPDRRGGCNNQDARTSKLQYISKWYLSKIESYDGEAIDLEYETTDDREVKYEVEIQQDTLDLVPGLGSFVCDYAPYSGNTDIPFISRLTTLEAKETTLSPKRVLQISSITGRINFEYDDSKFYYEDEHHSHQALKYIFQYDYKDQLIHKIELEHEYFSNGRLKLKSYIQYPLDLPEAPLPLRTSFDYNETENLPDINSPDQDFWGFYNGAGNSNLIPEITMLASDYDFLTSDVVKTGADRQPNEEKTQANILNKITYPKGGFTEFEYEQNEYYDEITEQNEPIGGLRIKSIKHGVGVDGSSNDITKEYEYLKDASSESSGETEKQRKIFDVQDYGDYLINPSSYNGSSGSYDRGLYILRSSYLRREQASDFIHYTRVSEKQTGNGKIVYEFTGFTDHEDNYLLKEYNYGSGSFTVADYLDNVDNAAGGRGTDNSDERGVPLKSIVYNEEGDKISETSYEYEWNPSGFSSNIVTALKVQSASSFFLFRECSTVYNDHPSPNPTNQIYSAANGSVLYVEYYFHRTKWHYLNKEITTIYDHSNSNEFATEKEFFYDSPSKLRSVISLGSDGRLYKTTYSYPQDYSAFPSSIKTDEASALITMDLLHIWEDPVETINSFSDDGTNYKITNATLTTFKEFGNFIKPFKVFNLDIKDPVDDFISFDLTTGNPIDISFDSRYQLFKTFTNYDINGNLICDSLNNGVSTSYLWDLTKMKLMAVCRNSKSAPFLDAVQTTCGVDFSYIDFENDFNDEWYFDDTFLESEDAHSGSNSFKLPANSTVNGYGSPLKFLYPNYRNTNYKVSAWVKTNNQFLSNKGSLFLKPVYLDGQNYYDYTTYVPEEDTRVQFGSTQNEWKYVEFVFDLKNYGPIINDPAGIHMPYLMAYVENSDDIEDLLIDDIRIEPVDGMMETFIYDPIWEKWQSSIDQNLDLSGSNQYDEFGRIKWKLNKNKEVLTYYDYYINDPDDATDHNFLTMISFNVAHSKDEVMDFLQNETLFSWEEYNRTIIYTDGLGRPIQRVGEKQSPVDGSIGKDIVSFVIYDEFGRPSKDYLSYTSPSDDGSFKDVLNEQIDFYTTNNSSTKIAYNEYPFSESVYDNSPLNKIKERSSPGEAWQLGNNHTTKSDYHCNVENEVLHWIKTTDGAEATTHYDEATLLKSEVEDEHGHKSFAFTDKLGRKICSWTEARTGLDDNGTRVTEDFTQGSGSTLREDLIDTLFVTYYVYNDMGQLAYTIPPAAMEQMQIANDYSFVESDNIFKETILASKYDERGRVYTSKKPGVDWENFVFDKLNRPVLTQTANQKNTVVFTIGSDEYHAWNFVKYDVFGRTIMTGLFHSKELPADLQTAATGSTTPCWEYRESTGTNVMEYTNTAFPVIDLGQNDEVHTVQYFDNYDFDKNGYSYQPFNGFTAKDKVKGFSTGSKVRILNSDPEKFLTRVNFYDDKGRILQQHEELLKDGKDMVSMEYNFSNLPTKTYRRHLFYK